MRDLTMPLLFVVVFVLVACGGMWLAYRNYAECRTQFSVLYCLTAHR